ncbi:amyloid protein-binding protein 2 [Trichogramma pretiosum]|uniref:amyloid protein-binding protein 2 n=1 Tax=Trichogramma pretiosum TaxID=7493 RepID=UPI0006C96A42|nr:amyloid protein-binding protein 2 [Trichogramma pretiosum]
MAAIENKPPTKSVTSLYRLSLRVVAKYYYQYKKSFTYLPEMVHFDLVYQLYTENKLSELQTELNDINVVTKLLNVQSSRNLLIKCFQLLVDNDMHAAEVLCDTYHSICTRAKEDATWDKRLINLGLRLGGFLNDAGWYYESEQILLDCRELCLLGKQNPQTWCEILDCCHKLIHAQASYCSFTGAAYTHDLALETIDKLNEVGYLYVNHAALYAEFSVLYFIRSEYDLAYKWSLQALKELNPSLPKFIIINVLRQAAKSCVVKREFKKAGLLIKQAIYLAKEIFDANHPKYSDVLIDYGFYLLNSDSIGNSVAIYKLAYEIRKGVYGKNNLNIAMAHEDLAYALYVQEYSSGKFGVARSHADLAIEIMIKILPSEHLMLASAKRVKALILEEIALDVSPNSSESDLLTMSEDLHMCALDLSRTAFGERNVQTAKHYGNLGRLYQSMRRFQEAEEMHLKAIGIKEELLGCDDYEVGLSIGHLASLYNFHMNRFQDAEALYYKSIEISLKLFGNSYSGLEYDYRGLLNVYAKLENHTKYVEYMDILAQWKELRDRHAENEEPPIEQKCPQPLDDVIQTFFSM